MEEIGPEDADVVAIVAAQAIDSAIPHISVLVAICRMDGTHGELCLGVEKMLFKGLGKSQTLEETYS